LFDAFKEHWPEAWKTVESAIEEVKISLEGNKISRIAINEDGDVVGWIGGIEADGYKGNVWELHPLVVKKDLQRTGIGSALVKDFEICVANRGGLTIQLGTDDEDNMTSLSNVDLYNDTWTHIKNIKNLKKHPYEFYLKQGFVIVGVMPDANDFGKPDIYMAKRVNSLNK